VILASGQFLMTLESSVMNVSIKSVANDLGTTVTGILTTITLYTLVMAAFMITGGKIGALIGRRRAFAIGLVGGPPAKAPGHQSGDHVRPGRVSRPRQSGKGPPGRRR
jgi:MFS family permease